MGQALIWRWFLVGLLFLIAGLLYFAIFYFSESNPAPAFYDLLLHGLAGLWLAAAIIYGWKAAQTFSFSGGALESFILIAGGVMLVGVLWEFYEFFINVYFSLPQETMSDTFSDFVAELVGAAVFFFGYRLTARNK